MKAKLYVPYVNYDIEHGFDANIELNGEDYVNYLNKGYNATKLDMNIGVKKNDVETDIFKKEKNTTYYEANISVLDINSNDANIDELLNYFRTEEMFIIQLYFDNIETLEDVEEEMTFWSKESVKINSSKYLTDDMKMVSLPVKDFKIEFGKDSKALLTNCRLMERFSVKRYAILVEKIIFIN